MAEKSTERFLSLKSHLKPSSIAHYREVLGRLQKFGKTVAFYKEQLIPELVTSDIWRTSVIILLMIAGGLAVWLISVSVKISSMNKKQRNGVGMNFGGR